MEYSLKKYLNNMINCNLLHIFNSLLYVVLATVYITIFIPMIRDNMHNTPAMIELVGCLIYCYFVAIVFYAIAISDVFVTVYPIPEWYKTLAKDNRYWWILCLFMGPIIFFVKTKVKTNKIQDEIIILPNDGKIIGSRLWKTFLIDIILLAVFILIMISPIL